MQTCILAFLPIFRWIYAYLHVYKFCSFLHAQNQTKQTDGDEGIFRGLKEEIEKTNLSISGIQEKIEILTKEEITMWQLWHYQE